MSTVPKSLHTWFIIHLVADYLAAIPLLIAPQTVQTPTRLSRKAKNLLEELKSEL